MRKPKHLTLQIPSYPQSDTNYSPPTPSPTGNWQKSIISALSNENFSRAKWALLKSVPAFTTGSFISDLWNQLQAIVNDNPLSSDQIVYCLLQKLECNQFDTLQVIQETMQLYDKLQDCFPNSKELESAYPDFSSSFISDRLDALQVFLNSFSELKLAHESFLFYLNLKSNVSIYDSDDTCFRVYIQDDEYMDLIYNWIYKIIGHVLPKVKKNLQDYQDIFSQMKIPIHLLNAPDVAQRIEFFAHGTLKAYVESLNIIEKSELSIASCDEILNAHIVKLRFALDIRKVFIDTGITLWLNEDIKSDYRSLLLQFALVLYKLFEKQIQSSIDILMFKLYITLDKIWILVLRIFAIRDPKMRTCSLILQFCQLENHLFDRIIRFGQMRESESVKTVLTVAIQNKKFDLLKDPSAHLLGFIKSLKSHSTTSYQISGKLKMSLELCDFLCQSRHVLIRVLDQKDPDTIIFASQLAVKYNQTLMNLLHSLYECFYIDVPSFQKGEYLLLFSAFDLNVQDHWKGGIYSVQSLSSFFQGKENSLLIIPSHAIHNLDLEMLFHIQDDIVINDLMCKDLHDCTCSLKDKLFQLYLLFMEIPIILKSILETNAANGGIIQSQFFFASAFGFKVRSVLEDPSNRQIFLPGFIKLGLEWTEYCSREQFKEIESKRWTLFALDFAMEIVLQCAPSDEFQEEFLNTDQNETLKTLQCSISKCLNRVLVMKLKHGLQMGIPKKGITAQVTQKEEARLDRILDKIAKLDKHLESKNTVGKVLDTESNLFDKNLGQIASDPLNVSIKWKKGRFLSKGSFGSVYMGINLDKGTYIAVKEVSFENFNIQSERILKYLHHPNICDYYGFELHRDMVYILMEYCPGSLERVISQGPIQDEEIVKRYCMDMLKGMHYLHSHGIAHRDIKPSNILFDAEGTLKFVDFGVALMDRNVIQVVNDRFSLVGTSRYLAPEIVKNLQDVPSTAQDIWAFGCTLYQMVSGKIPFEEYENEWAVMYYVGLGEKPGVLSLQQSSQVGIDFLDSCFIFDAFQRPTSFDLLQHKWFA